MARVQCGLLVALGLGACQPLHDLDAASGGGSDADQTNTSGGAGITVGAGSGVTPGASVPETAGTAPSALSPVHSGASNGGPTFSETQSDAAVSPTGGSAIAPSTNGGAGDGGFYGESDQTGGDAGSDTAESTTTAGEPDVTDTSTPETSANVDGTADSRSREDSSTDSDGSDFTQNDTGSEPPELSELPIDLPNNPVMEEFTVSTDAEWEVDGQMLPTFEIVTPTASYWFVKSLGMIVSMSAVKASDAPQWIAFSSGFRPLRGLPSFGTFGGAPAMMTTMDEESKTPLHLRLYSESSTGDWQLVYDFYPTHFTLTVKAMPAPYGIAYRGVPAGALDATDTFVRADGTAQGALVSAIADLDGPAEWAYLSDPTVGQSFFMIQHSDDQHDERFQVRDNDSALFSFGDGNLTQLPLRFSFGLIASTNHATVRARAEFIIDAIEGAN